MTSTLLERFRNDLQLAVISVVAALALLMILPFAAYRFASGQLLVGAIDTLIVLAIGWALTRAWRGGSVQHAGLLLATITTSSCLLVCVMFGRNGLWWAYVVFTTNFMLTERRYALVGNAVLLLVLAFHPTLFAQIFERVVFFATGSLVSMSAYLFAYHVADQHQRLVALASNDVLTGVANRLVMNADLALAVTTHRGSQPCGIAMLDLDRFKSINDAFGHEAGDRVLVEFVRIAEANYRKRDRLYRLGGEEFVLLMPDTPAPGLRAALEKLRGAVETHLRAPDGGAVTVSIGAAPLRDESDWSAWLARADAALYRAKSSGRNKVVLDGDPLSDAESADHERRGHLGRATDKAAAPPTANSPLSL